MLGKSDKCRSNFSRTPALQTADKLSVAPPLTARQMLVVGVSLASLVYFIGLVHFAQIRPLDGDEGYYTTAARLVWEGKGRGEHGQQRIRPQWRCRVIVEIGPRCRLRGGHGGSGGNGRKANGAAPG